MLANLVVSRMRIDQQQCLSAHHHAGNAVAALGRLFVDEGLLQLVRLALFEQAFKRGDLARADGGDRQDAGIRRPPIDMNHARAALPEAAAKFGAVQAEFIPQDIEERRRWLRVDLLYFAIDVQSGRHVFNSLPVSLSRFPGECRSIAAGWCSVHGHIARASRSPRR